MRDLNQKIADAEKRLARLRDKVRANDTRQKIVVGAIAISQALKTPEAARALLSAIEAETMRDHDKAVVAGLLEKLRELAAKSE